MVFLSEDAPRGLARAVPAREGPVQAAKKDGLRLHRLVGAVKRNFFVDFDQVIGELGYHAPVLQHAHAFALGVYSAGKAETVLGEF